MLLGVGRRGGEKIAVQADGSLVLAEADRSCSMQALIIMRVCGILPQQLLELAARLAVLMEFNEYFCVLRARGTIIGSQLEDGRQQQFRLGEHHASNPDARPQTHRLTRLSRRQTLWPH